MPRATSISQEFARPALPVASSEWARRINRMLREQLDDSAGTRPPAAQTDVLTSGGGPGVEESIRFCGPAAETLVRLGLKAPLLAELASSSAIDAKHLYEFAGIDRTTVSRRSARGDVLPQEVAVKAIEFAQLVATAADVFGTVADASRWLTRPHPALDSDTPLRRARTPWGLTRVRAVLGALKYGGVV